MIHFDTTKSAVAGHRSGLMRVTTRLLQELGPDANAVRWPSFSTCLPRDVWFLTTELFSEEERPGFTAWLDSNVCRTAAVFHDAIPLKLPHITWPKSVARHPAYMKLLSKFDVVWAVSDASRTELDGYWRWLGLGRTPAVEVLPLGADFNAKPRIVARPPNDARKPALLCIGILEPRKNQTFLLNVCDRLWHEGLDFDVHFVGRVNPHFGQPVLDRMDTASREHPGRVVIHDRADDVALVRLFAGARATVFPTIAEGCGLPLIESLWMGVPCVCSDLPVLRENAAGGGCVPVAANDTEAWIQALRRVLTDDAHLTDLVKQAVTRPLPSWVDAAAVLRRRLH